MHRFTVDYLTRADRHAGQLIRDRREHRFDRGYFIRSTMPTNPWCTTAGHTPRLVEYRNSGTFWIECRICGRRVNAHVPDPPHNLDPSQGPVVPYRERPRAARIEWEALLATIPTTGPVWSAHEVGAQAQVIAGGRCGWGFRVHVGSRGSETPYDLSVQAGVAAVYAGVGAFHRAAHWISGGRGRDLEVSAYSGSLWWKLWVQGEDYNARGRQTRRRQTWARRDGHVAVNPVDLLLGRRLYVYDDVAIVGQVPLVTTEGTTHLVDLTLRKGTRRRARQWWQADEWLTVDWNSPGGGIDTKPGGRGLVSGSGVRLDARLADRWVEGALAELRRWVTGERLRYGWATEPDRVG